MGSSISQNASTARKKHGAANFAAPCRCVYCDARNSPRLRGINRLLQRRLRLHADEPIDYLAVF